MRTAVVRAIPASSRTKSKGAPWRWRIPPLLLCLFSRGFCGVPEALNLAPSRATLVACRGAASVETVTR